MNVRVLIAVLALGLALVGSVALYQQTEGRNLYRQGNERNLIGTDRVRDLRARYMGYQPRPAWSIPASLAVGAIGLAVSAGVLARRRTIA